MTPLSPVINFLLDRHQLEINDAEWLPIFLRNAGYRVEVTVKPGPLDEQESELYLPDDCLVIVGSIPFTRHFMSVYRDTRPGAYYHEDRYRCTNYMHRFPADWLLNHEHVMIPFGDFKRRLDWFYEVFKSEQLFIRPDSGGKVFTGLSFTREKAEQELSSLWQLSRVPDNALILVSAGVPIEVEYRFVIVNRQVISGSQYMRAGKIAIAPEVDERCQALAEKVASHGFQVDIAYTCDIALSGGEPKMVELNAFSTSGLYACDYRAVFHAVAAAAWAENQYELSLED